MSLQAGTTLSNRYTLTARIAVGGMGEVWRATDDVLHRPVAVKVLKSEYTDDSDFLERFRAEARHTAGLSHPGIATVFDYGEIGDADTGGTATAYLVMEFVEGEPLSTLLRDAGRLSTDKALDITAQAAAALQAAHDAGVVHRDVKPGNLMVRPDGVVKVTDFGIARTADGMALTQTGTVLGTAYYLSPEQGAGRTVTSSSDVYSLGVVAYEMLAGRRPFPGTNPVQVAMAHGRDEPPPLPADLPAPVVALVEQAMSKDPGARPESAGALARAASALAGQARSGRSADLSTQVLPRTAAAAGVAPAAVVPPPVAPRPPVRSGPPTSVLPPIRESRVSRPAPPAPARRGNTATWVLVGLLATIGAVVLLLGLRDTAEVAQVTVPRVVGLTEAEAIRALDAADLDSRSVEQEGTDSPPGQVLASDPLEGTTADAGSTVVLTVAGGLPRVDVDPADYVGRPFDDVRAELSALGLSVARVPVTGDGVPGTVADVDPSGAVAEGTTIEVSVVEAPSPSPSPTPSPTPPPAPSEAPSEAPSPSPSAEPVPSEPAPSASVTPLLGMGRPS